MERTRLHVEDFVKQNDTSTVLQMVHDISNQMIAFERKRVTSTSVATETSTWADFRNQTNSFQSKAILPRIWCNFCEENLIQKGYKEG
jgi:hypothetical protein